MRLQKVNLIYYQILWSHFKYSSVDVWKKSNGIQKDVQILVSMLLCFLFLSGVVFWGFPRAEGSPSAHLRLRDHERSGWYLSLIFWEFSPLPGSQFPTCHALLCWVLSVHTSPYAFSCAECSPLARIGLYIPPAFARIYIPLPSILTTI